MSLGYLVDGCQFTDASIGEENVKAAVLVLNLSIKPVQVLEVAGIGLYAPSGGADFLCRSLHGFLATASDDDLRAFGHETFCSGEADTAASACNECYFPFELFRHVSFLSTLWMNPGLRRPQVI